MVEMMSRHALVLFAAQALPQPLALQAQAASPIPSAISAWIALDATPGRERVIG